jgi:hypothetical protein
VDFGFNRFDLCHERYHGVGQEWTTEWMEELARHAGGEYPVVKRACGRDGEKHRHQMDMGESSVGF